MFFFPETLTSLSSNPRDETTSTPLSGVLSKQNTPSEFRHRAVLGPLLQHIGAGNRVAFVVKDLSCERNVLALHSDHWFGDQVDEFSLNTENHGLILEDFLQNVINL